jgi:NDP-sugar pyrophosphorylase family protein
MMAVILAGGKGTRLQPFTMTIPKPLLPLGDIPILEVVIGQLAAAGVNRIILTLGHMAHLFIASIGEIPHLGVEIEYCREEIPLGTAGPIRLVKNLEENFIIMNGDLLTTIDYRALFSMHVKQNAWGTIAVNTRQINIDYGVVYTTAEGLLSDYREKPTITNDVSMGINVLSRRCLDFIPEGKKFDMPQLMLAMKQAGRPVFCYKTDCYWQDIGRFDDYQQASEDFVNNPSQFLSK